MDFLQYEVRDRRLLWAREDRKGHSASSLYRRKHVFRNQETETEEYSLMSTFGLTSSGWSLASFRSVLAQEAIDFIQLEAVRVFLVAFSQILQNNTIYNKRAEKYSFLISIV